MRQPVTQQPLVTNSENRQQIEDAEQKQQDLEELEVEGLLQTAKTQAGRHFLWRFLEHGSIFVSDWQGDPAYLAYREGQRNLALKLLALWTKWDIDSYTLAMREHQTG